MKQRGSFVDRDLDDGIMHISSVSIESILITLEILCNLRLLSVNEDLYIVNNTKESFAWNKVFVQ